MSLVEDVVALCYARHIAERNCNDCTDKGERCDKAKKALRVDKPYKYICLENKRRKRGK